MYERYPRFGNPKDRLSMPTLCQPRLEFAIRHLHALALDVTGSMAGTKVADLRDAAKELVDIVVQPRQSPSTQKWPWLPIRWE